MVNSCYFCHKRDDTSNKASDTPVSFHRLPCRSKHDKRQRWITQLGLSTRDDVDKLPKSLRVCQACVSERITEAPAQLDFPNGECSSVSMTFKHGLLCQDSGAGGTGSQGTSQVMDGKNAIQPFLSSSTEDIFINKPTKKDDDATCTAASTPLSSEQSIVDVLNIRDDGSCSSSGDETLNVLKIRPHFYQPAGITKKMVVDTRLNCVLSETGLSSATAHGGDWDLPTQTAPSMSPTGEKQHEMGDAEINTITRRRKQKRRHSPGASFVSLTSSERKESKQSFPIKSISHDHGTYARPCEATLGDLGRKSCGENQQDNVCVSASLEVDPEIDWWLEYLKRVGDQNIDRFLKSLHVDQETNSVILKTVDQGSVGPHLEYGSSAWMTAAKRHHQTLDEAQIQAQALNNNNNLPQTLHNIMN